MQNLHHTPHSKKVVSAFFSTPIAASGKLTPRKALPRLALRYLNEKIASDCLVDNNRMLHPDDKTKAKQLAALANERGLVKEDGSPVTETDINNQLAQMNKQTGDQIDSGGNRMAVGPKPQDGTEWRSFGVNLEGQQVWAQALPSADSSLQAFIIKNTGTNSSIYQPSTILPTTGFRGPDFINFQLDYYVGSVWGTFTRDGNSFTGSGVNFGLPNPVSGGANISLGWLNTDSVKPGQTTNFAAGYAGNGSASYAGFGGGIVVSKDNGTATVIGIGAGLSPVKINNPATFGLGYSVDQGNTGLKW